MDNIQRQWATQLLEEYLSICSMRAIPLSPPTINISSGEKTIGSWDAKKRIISISSELITSHDWDIVIEVLKHEMAHQYVTDITPSNETAHGSSFKKACEILNVHPDFIKATGPISDFLNQETEADSISNKTEQKIAKLLALANSAEEHEASLAMEKANELITKYNIELGPIKNGDEQSYRQIYVGNKQVSTWTKMIASIVTDYFFVYAIIIDQYSAKYDVKYKAIEFIGRKHNLDIAEHVFHFLSDRLEILWHNYRIKNNASGRDKRSYFYGLLNGFREKLQLADIKRNHQHDYQSTTSVMVVAQDHALQDFIQKRYPSVKRGRAKVRINKSVYESGTEDGKKINIHKTIHQKSESGKLLN